MDSQEEIDLLETRILNIYDMLDHDSLETSFEGEAVKFVDALEARRRLRLYEERIDKLKALLAGVRRTRIRAMSVRLKGDN